MKTLHERYRNDPYFYNLVQVFLKELENAKTTPMEIREAAMYAQYIYDLTGPAYSILKPDDESF